MKSGSTDRARSLLASKLGPCQYAATPDHPREKRMSQPRIRARPDGTIDEMKMLPVSPLTDFSFDFQDLLFTPAASGK